MEHVNTVQPQRGLFAGLFADYAEARVEQFCRRLLAKTVRELEQLSDQQLSDIGMPRDQIRQRAYDSVYHHAPYSP